jgi:hypothetical protein
MKKRFRNKERNLQISRFKKYKRQSPEADHKLFLSYDYLGYSDYCDCYFIGRFQKEKVLFNATFITLRLHAYDLAEELIDKAMDEKFPNRFDNFISFQRGDDINEYFNSPEENRYKDWALQQLYNMEEVGIRDSILGKGIEVQAFLEVLPEYQFGVGLHGAFDSNVFPEEKVIEFIQLINSIKMDQFSSPVYFGEKKRFHKGDLDDIQHSTPLVHISFQKNKD